MKLPSEKSKNEVFNMRIDQETKKKLEELAKAPIYKGNCSALIRDMIHSTYLKKR